MSRTVDVPRDCKVVFVTDQLIERMKAEQGEDGWSPARTIQVHVPDPEGLVVDPTFRYAATPEDAGDNLGG